MVNEEIKAPCKEVMGKLRELIGDYQLYKAVDDESQQADDAHVQQEEYMQNLVVQNFAR